MNPWPDLRPILQGIDWVIIGGVATRAYMPERMTKDLDILIHKEDGEAVIAKLKQAGYRVASRLAVPGYLMLSPEGVEVDVKVGLSPDELRQVDAGLADIEPLPDQPLERPVDHDVDRPLHQAPPHRAAPDQHADVPTDARA